MTRRIRSLFVSIALVGLFAAGAPLPARALSTIYVADSDVSYSGACASATYRTDDGAGPYDSDDDAIRAAISAAVNTSSVYLCRGTYTFTDPIFLPTGTTRLVGEGATKSIISGGGGTRLFESNGSEAFFVSNLTLTNGVSNWAAAIWAEDTSTLTLSGVTISDMLVTNGSAGIFSRYGTVTVDKSTFVRNRDLEDFDWGGGAIGTEYAAVIVSNSTFSGNQSDATGGAISAPSVTVTNSTFTDNDAYYGGAVSAGSVLNVTGSLFSLNTAEYQGGALYAAGVSATIKSSTFRDNSAESAGALFSGTTTLIQTSEFSRNIANQDFGGAVVAWNASSLTIENSKLNDNHSNNYGGAMNVNNIETVTLRSTTFARNTAYGNLGNGNGGAIDACAIDLFKIYSSTFEKNVSNGSGGALGTFCGSGPLLIDKSLFSQNSAVDAGGAVLARTMGAMTKNRFLRNSSGDIGGALAVDSVQSGVLTLSAGNTFTSNSAHQIGGVGFLCASTVRSEMDRWVAKNSFSSNRSVIDRTKPNAGILPPCFD